MKKIFIGLIVAAAFGFGTNAVLAQPASADGAPIVSIVDITNVIYPLPMPIGGGSITFTYKVTNPGDPPLNDVVVSDDYCKAMSGELGDVNGNHLLDPGETWIYTCTTAITKTTTHTATVTAYADGLEAVDVETATINVPNASTAYSPNFPNDGSNPNGLSLPNNGTNPGTLNITVLIWEILGGILVLLIIAYVVVAIKKQ